MLSIGLLDRVRALKAPDSGAGGQFDEGDGSRPRRRRWPIWLALFLAIVAVAAGLLFNRMVLDYRPITWLGGSVRYEGDHLGSVPGPVHDFRLVPLRRDGEFTMRLDVHNAGARAVKIIGLPAPEPLAYVRRVTVQIGKNRDSHGLGDPVLVPFQPFTLDPGSFRTVAWTFRFQDCEFGGTEISFSNGHVTAGNSLYRWTEQSVTYEVWGIRRDATFELPDAIGLVGSPMDALCPGPEGERS